MDKKLKVSKTYVFLKTSRKYLTRYRKVFFLGGGRIWIHNTVRIPNRDVLCQMLTVLKFILLRNLTEIGHHFILYHKFNLMFILLFYLLKILFVVMDR